MKDITKILFIPVVLLSALIPVRLGGVWHAQLVGLLFITFFFISSYIYNFNKELSIFSIICLLSTFFISKFDARAIVILMQLYFGIVVSYFISFSNLKTRNYINIAILSLVVLQIFWLMLQTYNIDPVFKSLANSKLDETVGLSAAKDQMGTFFALTMPVSLSFHPLLGLLNVAGCFISKSSFALVSAILSGLLYFYYTNRKLFKIVFISAVIIGIIFFSRFDKLRIADFKTRINVSRYALSSVLEGHIDVGTTDNLRRVFCNPLFGFGFGRFLSIFPYVPQQVGFNYANEKFTHAHNDYVELIFELGMTGLLFLLLLISNFIESFVKIGKDKELVLYFSVIAAYLLNASGNFLSHIAVSGAILMIYYGLYEARRRELSGQVTVNC